jgi:hypothetical protein
MPKTMDSNDNNKTNNFNKNKLNDILFYLFDGNFRTHDIIANFNSYFHIEKSKDASESNNNNNNNQLIDKNIFKEFLLKNYPLHVYYSQVLFKNKH